MTIDGTVIAAIRAHLRLAIVAGAGRNDWTHGTHMNYWRRGADETGLHFGSRAALRVPPSRAKRHHIVYDYNSAIKGVSPGTTYAAIVQRIVETILDIFAENACDVLVLVFDAGTSIKLAWGERYSKARAANPAFDPAKVPGGDNGPELTGKTRVPGKGEAGLWDLMTNHPDSRWLLRRYIWRSLPAALLAGIERRLARAHKHAVPERRAALVAALVRMVSRIRVSVYGLENHPGTQASRRRCALCAMPSPDPLSMMVVEEECASSSPSPSPTRDAPEWRVRVMPKFDDPRTILRRNEDDDGEDFTWCAADGCAIDTCGASPPADFGGPLSYAEGESGCVRYAADTLTRDRHASVQVVSVDGDLIFMLLLAARILGVDAYRLFLYRPIHYHPRQGGAVVHYDAHIDMGILYERLLRDPAWGSARWGDPLVNLFLFAVMRGTDFTTKTLAYITPAKIFAAYGSGVAIHGNPLKERLDSLCLQPVHFPGCGYVDLPLLNMSYAKELLQHYCFGPAAAANKKKGVEGTLPTTMRAGFAGVTANLMRAQSLLYLWCHPALRIEGLSISPVPHVVRKPEPDHPHAHLPFVHTSKCAVASNGYTYDGSDCQGLGVVRALHGDLPLSAYNILASCSTADCALLAEMKGGSAPQAHVRAAVMADHMAKARVLPYTSLPSPWCATAARPDEIDELNTNLRVYHLPTPVLVSSSVL